MEVIWIMSNRVFILVRNWWTEMDCSFWEVPAASRDILILVVRGVDGKRAESKN